MGSINGDIYDGQNQTDEEPLVDGSEVPKDIGKSRIRKPSRLVIIEPLLLMYTLFIAPTETLTSQYILDRLIEKQGVNLSDLNTSACSIVNTSDPDYILFEDAQSQTSYFSLTQSFCNIIPAVFVSFLLGGYSDKAGRKYAIIPPLVGQFVNTLVYLLVILLNLPLWILYIGAFINGCSGFYATLLMAAFSYVADVTTKENRTFRIVVVESCMGGSMIFSFIATGFGIEFMGYVWPFTIVFIGNALLVIYAIFLIPETIIKDPDARFFDVENIKQTFKLFAKDNGAGRRWKLNVILLSMFFSIMVGLGSNSIDTLFMRNHPLCWSSILIGIEQGIDVFVVFIGGLIGSKLLSRCMPDIGIVILSGVCSVVKRIYKAFIKNTAMMFSVSLFSPLTFLSTPTLRSMSSKMVLPTEQGSLFAGIATVELLCTLVGHMIFNPVYAKTASFMPGFVYFVMAGINLLSVLLMVFYVYWSKRERKQQISRISDELSSG